MLAFAQDYNELLTHIITEFYDHLAQDKRANKILSALSPAEQQHLKERQAQHWNKLLDPNTSSETCLASAKKLGEVHAIMGVPSASIASALGYFEKRLFEAINPLPLTEARKLAIKTLVSERIQKETEIQLKCIDKHFDNIDQLIRKIIEPASNQMFWIDKLRHRLQTLNQLAGTAGVLWIAKDHNQQWVVELSETTDKLDSACLFNHLIEPHLAKKQAVHIANTSQVQYGCDFPHIRSISLYPVYDHNDRNTAWLVLLGRYPAMFLARATTRLIDITISQFRFDFIVQERVSRHLGVNEQQIDHLKGLLYGNGLCFHYQPIVNLENGDCFKVEALARLVDPEQGILPPAKFLPYLGYEEIKYLFIQGLQQGFAQLKAWDKQGKLFHINLNLPPEVLIAPECTDWISHALHTYQIDGKRLHLELLESSEPMNESARDSAIIALNNLGISLKMDDLGSGHSGLIRLKNLPFSGVKIDQELIRGLKTTQFLKSLAIINSLLAMAKQIGLSAVVEGLETEEEIEIVTIMGADYGQGYGIARPMPADQILPWLSQFTWTINNQQPKTVFGKLVSIMLWIEEMHQKQRLTFSDDDCIVNKLSLPLHPDSAALHEKMHRLFNEGHYDEARSIGFEFITSYLQNERLI